MLTLANLLCGFFAIFVASRPRGTELIWDWSPLTLAAVLIFVGMVFDGLDGRVARLTRSTSDLGEQLDSMADMVTFGAAPALIAVGLAGVETPFVSEMGDDYFNRAAVLAAGVYVLCAALRLARFNVQLSAAAKDDHLTFMGLPSPGAAGTVASLVLLHEDFVAEFARGHPTTRFAAVGMVAVMLLAAFAMVSRLPYAHLVQRYMRGRARVEYVARIVAVGMLLAITPQGALALAFVAYALSAPVQWLWRQIPPNRKAAAAETETGSTIESPTAATADPDQ